MFIHIRIDIVNVIKSWEGHIFNAQVILNVMDALKATPAQFDYVLLA